MTLSERAAAYNNRTFTPETRKTQDEAGLDFHPELHVRTPAPDFTAYHLDGTKLKLSDFRGKKHVAFAFGCLTAPIFINDIPELNRLHRKFAGTDIAILIIYAREAHAAENYPPHSSLEQKLERARELRRVEGVEPPLVADSLEGDAHRLYGIRPNVVWAVNKEGLIFYKATSLIAHNLELVLDNVLEVDALKDRGLRVRQMYSESWLQLGINPLVHERVLNRAGESARKEVAKAFGHDPVTQGHS